MTQPSDSDLVLTAIRLGWYVAEVRGRNRPDGPRPQDTVSPQRDADQLPLRVERSFTELRIEAQIVMTELAKKLAKNSTGSDTQTETVCQAIDGRCKDIWTARKAGQAELALQDWERLRKELFEFDKGVQDLLAAYSDTQACGYQLGRGLAESYWQLDIEARAQDDDHPTWNSWSFLMGDFRCQELSRLAGRLSAYFHTYTATGVSGSLAAWKEVASSRDWRTEHGPDGDEAYVRDQFLYRQMRRWYELVVLLQDPSTLIKPFAIFRSFRAAGKALRGFWLQLVGATASLVLVATFLVFLSSNQKSGWEKSLFGILSVIGISATTISTKLKNAAQSLLARIHTDTYGDLVGLEITTVPPPPLSLAQKLRIDPKRQDRIISRAVQSRSITAVNPSPS
jgi:hypothetical protein